MLFLFLVFSRGTITIIANLGKRSACAVFYVPLPNHNVQPIRLSYYLHPNYVLDDIDVLAVFNEPEFMFSCAIIERLEVVVSSDQHDALNLIATKEIFSTIQEIAAHKWRVKITVPHSAGSVIRIAAPTIIRWLCGEVFSSWDMSPISMIGNAGKERNND
ncbi:hypothetical protein JR782_004551 [Salmonella enterica subsp. enterica serovar Eastbourne]|nr:hypothetical protein [Salmonella enterica subsp. enterica serovar Eastbourne]EHC5909963.1 hypothetical protein [Salmonella enterica subsp. enterica serovar Eastbourne]EHD1638447.1 hypothetical protein [Salmonella enterica]